MESPSAITPRASCTPSLGGETRLSRISGGTKSAIALNQIERMEFNSTYDREEDGVTMYVLDIYVWQVQTGLPTSRRSKSARGECNYEEAAEDPVVKKRELEKKPHYRMAYRFSDFYQLRRELKEVIDDSTTALHVKWCRYCSRLSWIVHTAPFPSRCAFDSMVKKNSWLRRWRIKRRQGQLACFLDLLVRGIRAMQGRFTRQPCDRYLSASHIIKEFLSEPHIRLSCAAW